VIHIGFVATLVLWLFFVSTVVVAAKLVAMEVFLLLWLLIVPLYDLAPTIANC
jgi:hypothetical protein